MLVFAIIFGQIARLPSDGTAPLPLDGPRGDLENSRLMPIADGLPTRKPSETSSSPPAQARLSPPKEKAPLRARAGHRV